MDLKKGYYLVTSYALLIGIVRSITFQQLGLQNQNIIIWAFFDTTICWAIVILILWIVSNIIKITAEIRDRKV